MFAACSSLSVIDAPSRARQESRLAGFLRRVAVVRDGLLIHPDGRGEVGGRSEEVYEALVEYTRL